MRHATRARVDRPAGRGWLGGWGWLGLALAGLGCAGGSTGCRTRAPEPARAVFEGQDPPLVVQLEVVRRPEELARGLMFREQLAADAGMLFVYPVEDIHPFWMKNTLIPLDMIFIGADGRVVGSVENTVPLSLERCTVDVPSRYVLEVNAGFVRRHAIRLGYRVRFEGLPDF